MPQLASDQKVAILARRGKLLVVVVVIIAVASGFCCWRRQRLGGITDPGYTVQAVFALHHTALNRVLVGGNECVQVAASVVDEICEINVGVDLASAWIDGVDLRVLPAVGKDIVERRHVFEFVDAVKRGACECVNV